MLLLRKTEDARMALHIPRPRTADIRRQHDRFTGRSNVLPLLLWSCDVRAMDHNRPTTSSSGGETQETQRSQLLILSGRLLGGLVVPFEPSPGGLIRPPIFLTPQLVSGYGMRRCGNSSLQTRKFLRKKTRSRPVTNQTTITQNQRPLQRFLV